MSKQKLTPWFPADVNPVHVGWYPTISPLTNDQGEQNQWWNGVYWFNTNESKIPLHWQNREWRGLAVQPK